MEINSFRSANFNFQQTRNPYKPALFVGVFDVSEQLIFEKSYQDSSLEKPRAAKSASPIRLKLLIEWELLMFENFNFFGKMCRNQCAMPVTKKFCAEGPNSSFKKHTIDRSPKNLFVLNLEIY